MQAFSHALWALTGQHTVKRWQATPVQNQGCCCKWSAAQPLDHQGACRCFTCHHMVIYCSQLGCCKYGMYSNFEEMFLFWKEGHFSLSINDIVNVANDYINQEWQILYGIQCLRIQFYRGNTEEKLQHWEMCNVNTTFTKNMTQSKKILNYIYAITITFCRK